jgi:hypothetical protein
VSIRLLYLIFVRLCGAPGEGHHRDQAGVRHEIRVVERCASSRGHATIALTRCPLEPGPGSLDNSHSPRSEGTFHVNTPENTTI